MKDFWCKHKKKILVVGGITLGVVALGGLGVWAYNKCNGLTSVPGNQLMDCFQPVQPVDTAKLINTVNGVNEVITNKKTPINGGDPFPVSGFVRRLPDGCHASDTQVELARRLGVELAKNQTYVREYYKNL